MIKVQNEDFTVAEEYAALRCNSSDAGAIVTFTGLVREMIKATVAASNATNTQANKLQAMELEHYPGMTLKALSEIEVEARKRWDIDQVRIIHRVGKLLPQEQIVFVGVSSAHRREAYNACEFIMDFLKTKAPFWKKEITNDGAHWVDAKDSDDSAAQRWK